MDAFNAFSMFTTGNVTLKAHAEIFGRSISLSKFTSINFGISYAGILSKPVKKKRTSLKVNTCPKRSSISPLSTCVKNI